jgi:DNA repair exonuclease SbcCD nuclease subunit
MRFAGISDLHLWSHAAWGGHFKCGLNDRARECLRTLETALKALRGHHVFVLGDVFDRVRPEPQLLEATRQALRTPGPESVTLLVGNHDRVSAEPSDHALGPLEWPDEVQIVAVPEVIRFGEGPVTHEILCVPHVPCDDFSRVLHNLVVTNFPKVSFGNLPTGRRILMLHAGIYDDGFPVWAKGSKGAVAEPWLRRLCGAHGISVVWAGDWHDRRIWDGPDVWIEQVGTLLPHTFGDAGADRGHVTRFDTAASECTMFQVPGPRFFEGEENLGTAVELAPTHPVYYREYRPPEQIAERRRAIEAVSSGQFRAIEVLPEKVDAVSLTRAAARGTDVEMAVRRAAEAHGREIQETVAEQAMRYLRAT